MIPVKCEHPSGLIAVPSNDLGRYIDFEQSMYALQVPVGSQVMRKRGPSVARNRNDIVKALLASNHQWLCFLDDDQVIPPDTILKLLSHRKGIVGGLYSGRRPPFYPMAMSSVQGAHMKPLTWTSLKEGPRLRMVVAAGTGCMLVRREVFGQIPRPWFHATEWTDDLHFCMAAGRAGLPVWVDRDAVVGHTGTINTWPDMEHGGVTLVMDDLMFNLSDDAGAAALTVEVTPGAEDHNA